MTEALAGRLRWWGGGAAAFGAAALAVLLVVAPASFAPGYLAALLLVGGLPLGLAMILSIHMLTGGRWGEAVARVAMPALALVWLLPVAAIPLVLARPLAELPGAFHGGGRGAWMHPAFILARAGAAMLVWILIAMLMRRSAREGGRNAKGLGAASLILLVVTICFVSMDWLLLHERPRLTSSIFGLTVVAALAGTALALVALAACAAGLGERDPERLRDLGALLLAAVCLDVYAAFSQFFIVWNGNLPDQVEYYVSRAEGWLWLTIAMVVLRYALPIPALVSGRLKRSGPALALVAGMVLAGGALQAAWIALPSADATPATLLLTALASIVMLAGAAALAAGALGESNEGARS